jgi:hypothetical protein
MTHRENTAITTLLGQRFGDGLIYLLSQHDRYLLQRATALGLVNAEGYITPAGYRLWQRTQYTDARANRPSNYGIGSPGQALLA